MSGGRKGRRGAGPAWLPCFPSTLHPWLALPTREPRLHPSPQPSPRRPGGPRTAWARRGGQPQPAASPRLAASSGPRPRPPPDRLGPLPSRAGAGEGISPSGGEGRGGAAGGEAHGCVRHPGPRVPPLAAARSAMGPFRSDGAARVRVTFKLATRSGRRIGGASARGRRLVRVILALRCARGAPLRRTPRVRVVRRREPLPPHRAAGPSRSESGPQSRRSESVRVGPAEPQVRVGPSRPRRAAGPSRPESARVGPAEPQVRVGPSRPRRASRVGAAAPL